MEDEQPLSRDRASRAKPESAHLRGQGRLTSKDKNLGLYQKYVVERTDGKPVGACYVLEFHDPLARAALAWYSQYIRPFGFEKLSDDIMAKVREHADGRAY